MAYLDTSKAAIVLRESDSPQGVWSDGGADGQRREYPELYGGFIHPWSSGNDLYFTMSDLVRLQRLPDARVPAPVSTY